MNCLTICFENIKIGEGFGFGGLEML